ncbi:MAG: PH domain-containing protein [Oscillospiraceae bacterium]
MNNQNKKAKQLTKTDKNKFEFKKDFSSTFLLIGFTVMTIFFDFCLITDYSINLLILSIILTLITIFIFSIYFNSYCYLAENHLIIKSGFLPKEKILYEKIYYISGKTDSNITDTTYIGKLQITFDKSNEKSNKKKGRNTIVSPAQTKMFIDCLKEKNPKIIDEIKVKRSM